MMQQPPDLDAFLRDILAESDEYLEAARHAERFTAGLHADSQAVMVTEDADGKLRYLVMNMDRPGALAIMARLGARFAEKLDADLNEA
jgi:hypothetical protein